MIDLLYWILYNKDLAKLLAYFSTMEKTMRSKYLPLAMLSLLFAACNNSQVDEATNSADIPTAAPTNNQVAPVDTPASANSTSAGADASTSAQ